ncbi:MAG: dihydrodipicolinate synthase family protein [Thermoplasmata archaeon]|uniref:Dihydrodipicolinate synthase family protein n=1 Tax=Candidatus Sysuiplasma superficiale TaxID=2823368 RepID=A0A8J8CAC4_9ARCH|nr:dihydrodipicolinate synthase family protein [Candidatus Sysuiplasma superficiale]MBX8643870.1 dihydrodipicolinate synthase family protein [Candidatus Sysuiplasma superficiale]
MVGLTGKGKIRGIIPALPTFFTEGNRISYRDLRSAINFAVECGASGIAALVIAGEFYKMSEDERRKVAFAAIKAAEGRLPVYIGVSHSGLKPAVDLAKHAISNGADGVILSPPYFYPMKKEIYETAASFVSEFCSACDCPVILQLFQTEDALPLSVAKLRDVLLESKNIEAIKIEGSNAIRMIRLIRRGFGSRISILGGMLGMNLAEELNSGSSGTIPGLSFSDVFVKAFNAFGGRTDDCGRILSRLEPYFSFTRSHFDQFVAVEKELLVLRKVIANSRLRSPCIPLTDSQRFELRDRILPACRFGW